MKIVFLLIGVIAGLLVVGGILGALAVAAYVSVVVLFYVLTHLRTVPVIVRIAFRNLTASRLKTFIVGGIITFAGALIVVGISFLGSITDGMSRSIIGAAAGDLQVYSAKSKDELAIWGQMGGDPDLAAIDDFSKLKAELEKVPNVKSVVPMGISGALVTSGNTIDLALADLRDAENKKKAGDATAAVQQRIDAQKAHLRHIIDILQGDQKNRAEVSAESRATTAEEAEAVARASDPKFWDSFEQDPFGSLEFLENKIAPLAADADLVYLRYIGTDMDAFQKNFDRMEIVDGARVPEGHRGFLFAKNFYEDSLKLKSAKRLDDIKEAIETKHQLISKEEELQRLVRENSTQTREIVLQLDEVKAKEMTARLQKITGSSEASLEKLLSLFFQTTDQNFAERYQAFYAQLAPLLELYRIRVGDTLTIKSFTKSGYVKSVNVKVYGTFQFKGLEKSALAGSLNLMDLQSFRDLYGFYTQDTLKEVERIKQQSGAKEVDRGKAEDELFGSGEAASAPAPDTGRTIEANATPGVNVQDASGVNAALREKEAQGRVFSQSDLDQGAVLNAAVFLKDPGQLNQTAQQIEKATTDAGMPVHAVSWQKASGNIGQLVLLFWAIFVIASGIIAFVATIIVNNALLTATLERIREFGTLRAIGAQKPFILTTVVIEAMVMGVVFGGLGALFGLAIVELVHTKGIAATADIMYFLFSGPRFLPALSVPSLFIAVVVMFFISAFASLIPAFLAMRVSPVRAMQAED